MPHTNTAMTGIIDVVDPIKVVHHIEADIWKQDSKTIEHVQGISES